MNYVRNFLAMFGIVLRKDVSQILAKFENIKSELEQHVDAMEADAAAFEKKVAQFLVQKEQAAAQAIRARNVASKIRQLIA